MKAFARAVFWGTLAGAWLPLMFTSFIAMALLSDGVSVAQAFLMAISPILVTLPIVLGSSVLLGFPTVWLLKHLKTETTENYLFAGALAGFLVPLAILVLMKSQQGDGWWMAPLGSFSGSITAVTWARARQIG